MIALTGALTKYPSFWQRIFGGTSMQVAQASVELAASTPGISSIILLIDSPGGTVDGTNDLADAVFAARAKKSIVAYVSDLAASGAYWVASQAHAVYANATALVGSIGVYAVVNDWSQFFAEAGVKVHVIRAGEFKGAGTIGTEITADQLAEWQRIVDATNRVFLAAVERGRGMSSARVKALADGRLQLASDASYLGLIDGVRPFSRLLTELQAAGSRPAKPRISAAREFKNRVAAETARLIDLGTPAGAARHQALARVARADRALHARVLTEANPGKAFELA